MNYTVTPAEKSTVKIAITFTPEEWAAANDKAYLENRKKFAVNGFRKGKVPKHVLELYYGKGLFYEDALNDLFVEHYPAILEKEKEAFTPVGDPALSVEEISDEKVVLNAVTPVKPDVTIEKYTGIKIEKFEYTVRDADVDKDVDTTRERLAESKEVSDRPAKLTDTVNIDFVGKCEGEVFGKPKDEADAMRMLRALSGREHRVHTGVCICRGRRAAATVETTVVHFSPIAEDDLCAYVRTPEPYDKAGAYAIQGHAALWCAGIEGCYYNIMGLPVHRTAQLLREFT